MRISLSLLMFFVLAGLAHAHLGHLGELAGHSHWIALGAGAVAAAIAAALGKRNVDKEKEQTIEETGEETDAKPVGEPAEALT